MQADTLTDNPSANTAGMETASGETWLTASFGTDASGYTLSGVTLLLDSTGSVDWAWTADNTGSGGRCYSAAGYLDDGVCGGAASGDVLEDKKRENEMKKHVVKAGAGFNRREMIVRTAGVLTLAGLGPGMISKALAQTSASGVVTPEETEGPYWVDEQLNHSDLATDPTDNSIQVGLPLVLTMNVSQYANGKVTPLQGAYVDLWHCNAYGIYSDEAAYNPGGGTGTVATTGKKFLRGYQVTDMHGNVRFTSIYPGWYTSRTLHIHARVRLYSGTSTTENFTTQFFFDDAITDVVYQMAPYNIRPNRDTINTTDNVYTGTDCVTSEQVGTETTLRLAQDRAMRWLPITSFWI